MAAQSTITALTVTHEAGASVGTPYTRGFAIQNFGSPAKVTTTPSGTEIRYVEGGAYSIKQNESAAVTVYTVSESLSAIAAVTEGAVVLTVDGTGIAPGSITSQSSVSMLFDVNKVYGPYIPNGTGTIFGYRETGAADAVYYSVTESLSAIIAAAPVGPPNGLTGSLNTPYFPYATGANTLADSTIYFTTADSTLRLGAGSSIGSQIAGETMVDMGAGGDEFNVSTDAGAYAESYMTLSPTQSQIGLGADGLVLTSGVATLTHTTEILLNSPRTRIAAGGILASYATNVSQIDFGAGGDEVNVSTDAAAYLESFIRMSPTQASFGNVAAAVIFDATASEIKHGTKVYVNSPLLEAVDAAAMDVDTPAGTYSMFNTNASVVNIGRAGATVNVASTLLMQGAPVQMAAGAAGYPSANIPAGIAPAAPADGDVWSTAANNELVMRQNGVSATLLSAKAVTTEVVVSDTTVTVVIGGVTYKLLAVA